MLEMLAELSLSWSIDLSRDAGDGDWILIVRRGDSRFDYRGDLKRVIGAAYGGARPGRY